MTFHSQMGSRCWTSSHCSVEWRCCRCTRRAGRSTIFRLGSSHCSARRSRWCLGLVDLDSVPSFDCQENPDDLDSVDPVCTTTHLPGTTRSNRRSSGTWTFIFLHNSGLKDNNINANSTKTNCPTKRLDTVDSTTGRIIDTIPTLEINNITLIEEETTGIGHFEHKRQ